MTTTIVDTRLTTSPQHCQQDDGQVDDLARGWLNLWNGDLSQAQLILSPDFCTHAALTGGGDGSEINSPRALAAWVARTRAAVADLRFTVQVGPIAAGEYLVSRWRAQGSYAGGIPGAAAPVGTPIDFTGTDLLRIAGGQLAEYWVNSDTLLVLSQLRALG